MGETKIWRCDLCPNEVVPDVSDLMSNEIRRDCDECSEGILHLEEDE